MIPHVTRCLELCLDLVFPHRCPGCGDYLPGLPGTSDRASVRPVNADEPAPAPPDVLDARHWACATCAPTVYRIGSPRCPQCALPLARSVSSTANDGIDLVCKNCVTLEPAFEAGWAAWEYEGLIAEVLAALKYGGRLEHARTLGRALAPGLHACLEALSGDAPLHVVPVPMHVRDLRRRGFNAAALLLRQALAASAWRPELTLVRKRRLTAAQAGLARTPRLKNLRGAFDVPAGRLVPGATVVVFDDVMTTGATMHAVASALRKAGAGRVVATCAARAV